MVLGRYCRIGLRAAVSLACATICLTTACRDNSSNSANTGIETGKPQVYVVNYPLRFFTERIGGDLIDVHFPLPADIDPAFWNPTADEIVDYQKGDLILLNGAEYAKWIQHASLSGSKLVNTTDDVKDQYIQIKNSVTHQHGPKGEHSHAGIAFTTWLDPKIAVKQVVAVKNALQRLLPDAKLQLENQHRALQQELMDLDSVLEKTAKGHENEPLLASHPVYQYFAKRYGLNVESVHWEPDEMPEEKSWSELRSLLATHPAKWMLWEAQPTEETVLKLKELGITSVVFSAVGNTPADGDYLSVMRKNASRLQTVFE